MDRIRSKGILDNHLFGNRSLSSLTPKEGLDYILKRQQTNASAGTIRREWQVLMRLLNLAVRYDWLDKNRLKAVELPDAIRRTRVAMPPELDGIRLLRDRVMPEVLAELWRVIVAELNTGLRESKLLAVHRSWIREEVDGWWLILPPSQSRLKGTPTRIPLNASALWALRDPLPSLSDGRVFRRWDDGRAFKKYWARVCGLAKIQDLHFHDLRHTFATRLQGLGVDYEARQALLGHRMPGMTASYSHGGPAWDQKLREAMTILDKAFKMSYGLSYERPAVAVGDPNYLKNGEPAGTRTQGPRLKRAMLYRLSYRLTSRNARILPPTLSLCLAHTPRDLRDLREKHDGLDGGESEVIETSNFVSCLSRTPWLSRSQFTNDGSGF